MENRVKEILNQLDNGKIIYKDAIKLIKNINFETNIVKKKASKLKISVVDEKQSIRIPAIPLGLITFLIDIGFGISSIAMKYVDDFDEDLRKILDSLDKKDIKLIFKELKKYGSFELVDIKDGDSTEIKITIL
ncbi:hypothetical protein [Clostridium sp. Cult1]|uniref:hypothetical protein n=1 Tax=Clostridium sp. Cult1 TaxID=2079002 RepID=UPI001F337DFD|nr:hypothetical protein [Clostridium sp. Cult1]MCF6463545.1 hypothetical protein [Clostridium sp. Cult1]